MLFIYFTSIEHGQNNVVGLLKIIELLMFQEHSRFVQAVRFSPNGNFFASAGFDGKVFLYDGTNADLVSEFGSPAHKGGVYGVRKY